MGTRSRLVIRRNYSGKKPIYLWMKWDGYFEGVGAWLCAELKKLLETYTMYDIRRMINGLDLEDETDGQNFDSKDLIPFLEGKKTYKNDPRATRPCAFRMRTGLNVRSLNSWDLIYEIFVK